MWWTLKHFRTHLVDHRCSDALNSSRVLPSLYRLWTRVRNWSLSSISSSMNYFRYISTPATLANYSNPHLCNHSAYQPGSDRYIFPPLLQGKNLLDAFNEWKRKLVRNRTRCIGPGHLKASVRSLSQATCSLLSLPKCTHSPLSTPLEKSWWEFLGIVLHQSIHHSEGRQKH